LTGFPKEQKHFPRTQEKMFFQQVFQQVQSCSNSFSKDTKLFETLFFNRPNVFPPTFSKDPI
jgi:hypothetical protein